jgi:hypothetical protein
MFAVAGRWSSCAGDRSGSGLLVASVRRRLLAWLIDVTVGLAGVGATAVGIALLGKAGVLGRLGRSRPAGVAGRRIHERFAERDPATVGAVLGSTRVQLALQLFGLTMGVLARNRRGAGFRLLGLRRVDGQSGGQVGIRAALVRGAVEQSRRALLNRIFAPARRRTDARRSELAPGLARLLREHAGNPEALKRDDAVLSRPSRQTARVVRLGRAQTARHLRS